MSTTEKFTSEPSIILEQGEHTSLPTDAKRGTIALVGEDQWVKGLTWLKMNGPADSQKGRRGRRGSLAAEEMQSYSPRTAAKANAAEHKKEKKPMDQNSVAEGSVVLDDDLPEADDDTLYDEGDTDAEASDDEGYATTGVDEPEDGHTVAIEADDDDDLPLDDEAATLSDDGWEESAEVAPEEQQDDADAEVEAEVEDDQPEVAADEAEPTPVEEKKAKGKAKGKTKPKAKAKRSRENARPRGLLEADIKDITDALDDGEIELDSGELMTPHRAARLLAERDGLPKPPSTGAVTNIFKRWGEIGYALLGENPLHYRRKSAKGQKEGLDTLKERYSEKRKQERRQEKAAASSGSEPTEE